MSFIGSRMAFVMSSSNVLTMILAGGSGLRLPPLTGNRCKPAVPSAYNKNSLAYLPRSRSMFLRPSRRKTRRGRLDEEQPGRAGGSLTSKPAWSNTYGCSATPAFFFGGVDNRNNPVRNRWPSPDQPWRCRSRRRQAIPRNRGQAHGSSSPSTIYGKRNPHHA